MTWKITDFALKGSSGNTHPPKSLKDLQNVDFAIMPGPVTVNPHPNPHLQGKNVLIPYVSRKATQKLELIPHPLGQGKESKTP